MTNEIIEAHLRSLNTTSVIYRCSLVALAGLVVSAIEDGNQDKALTLAQQLFQHLQRDVEGGERDE